MASGVINGGPKAIVCDRIDDLKLKAIKDGVKGNADVVIQNLVDG